MPVSTQRVVECVREVEKQQEHLVLIVGKPGSGKSKILRDLATMRAWEFMDARELITDELLEMLPKARPAEAPVLMAKEMARLRADVILLDNLDVLFTPVLNLDPLPLIRQLSRKFSIVASWTGSYEEGSLLHEQAGRETVAFFADDLMVIDIG